MSTKPTYTWETILAAVPAPTPAAVKLYTLATPPAVLIESGSRIRSEKILTDLVRFAGVITEFHPKATPTQKKRLLGFSEGFFRVVVHEGAKLRNMVASRAGNVDEREAKRLALINEASQTYSEGLDERDRLLNALLGLSGYDPGLADRIALARGRVTDGASLQTSLRALVSLAGELRKDPQSVLAQQLEEGGVTDAELAEIEAAGDKAKAAAEAAAGARAQGPVTQAELDQQDGVCLAHMGRLIRIFEGAHDKDPLIPRLVPIATRRIFAPSKARGAEGTEAEGTEAEGTGTGAAAAADKPKDK